MPTAIYGLFSTRNGEIRYVGRTRRAPEDRLWEHLTQFFESRKLTAEGRPLFRWLHDEYSAGHECMLTVVDECDDHVSAAREKEIIWRIPGLVNKQHSMMSGWDRHKQDKLARKIERANLNVRLRLRHLRQNVQGYRGIIYSNKTNIYYGNVYMSYESVNLKGERSLFRYFQQIASGEISGFWTLDDAVSARAETRQQLLNETCCSAFSWPDDRI